ncbi:MAG: histidine kinase, partial [Cytophagales bacterium]|nr:histidine kinase [Cytophagales bacterium]
MARLFIHHPIFRLLGPALYGTAVYVLALLFFDSLEQLTR